MKPLIWPGGWIERLAVWANLAPGPVADALLGMTMARTLMAGVELGIFATLSQRPASAEEVAERCGLDGTAARLLLQALAALGHLRLERSSYVLAPRARRWLDPASPTYVGDFLRFNYLQWQWWSGLEDVVRTGRPWNVHGWKPDDPRWEIYIRGMLDLARLSGPEVARRLRMPTGARSLIDLAGGHGWFAAEVCRRHPGLAATVMDLPGGARVGRRIIADAGLTGCVTHAEGDVLSAPLGGPYDAALCFQLIHHLAPEQNVLLFQRIASALRPGGVVAVLDYFSPPPGLPPDTSALLGLHFFLTSSAATYQAEDLRDWLTASGFGPTRRVRVRSIPIQTLYEAARL